MGTYEWNIVAVESAIKPDIGAGEIKITNAHGSISSFVPERAGKYKVTLNVYDGCNPVATSSEVHLIVSCPASNIPSYTLQLDSFDKSHLQTEAGVKGAKENTIKADCENGNQACYSPMRDTVIRYNGYRDGSQANPKGTIPKPRSTRPEGPQIDQAFAVKPGITKEHGTYYKLSAREPAPCYVKKSYFKYVSRSCSTAYDTSALPPSQTSSCETPVTCEWSVTEYPCKAPDNGWTSAGAQPTTPLLNNNACAAKATDGVFCVHKP